MHLYNALYLIINDSGFIVTQERTGNVILGHRKARNLLERINGGSEVEDLNVTTFNLHNLVEDVSTSLGLLDNNRI